MLRRTFAAASPRGRILLPDLVVANRRQLFSRSTSDQAKPAISFNRHPVNASSFTTETAVGLYASRRASSRPKRTISSEERSLSFGSPRNRRTPWAGLYARVPCSTAQVNIPESRSATRAAVPAPPVTIALPRAPVRKSVAVFPLPNNSGVQISHPQISNQRLYMALGAAFIDLQSRRLFGSAKPG